MVKHSAVVKCIFIVGVAFIAVSIMEFIVTLLFINLELNFDGDKVLIQEMLLDQSYLLLDGLFAWILLHVSIVLFMILGLVFIMIAKKDSIEEMLLAKHLIIIGMVLFILSFTKLEYIVILANQNVLIDKTYTFESALYDPDVSPYPLAGSLWFFYISTCCAYLVLAILTTATAIKWVLELEEQRGIKKEDSGGD